MQVDKLCSATGVLRLKVSSFVNQLDGIDSLARSLEYQCDRPVRLPERADQVVCGAAVQLFDATIAPQHQGQATFAGQKRLPFSGLPSAAEHDSGWLFC